eukprot:CAMPEP_0184735244 /NCGR_PEP_ID=MMETSP0314-20130426/61789_1 /TAXON_ID=38298 /ORGANISM="Rhodella maculata, Strain CCMP 736" /LENGTH=126 /DNA_ID=CAMNT_0027202277 /DNA_START=313 /DNA_END=694 /DNA_ORIENTATION=+
MFVCNRAQVRSEKEHGLVGADPEYHRRPAFSNPATPSICKVAAASTLAAAEKAQLYDRYSSRRGGYSLFAQEEDEFLDHADDRRPAHCVLAAGKGTALAGEDTASLLRKRMSSWIMRMIGAQLIAC